MQIDNGLAVVIAAVLIFYLRLIILQRERVKRLQAASPVRKGKSTAGRTSPVRYSILSQSRRDQIIAALGALAILAGLLLYSGLLPVAAAQAYWWAPTALGIVAFSWAFRL